jgi:hypothetical protein
MEQGVEVVGSVNIPSQINVHLFGASGYFSLQGRN